MLTNYAKQLSLQAATGGWDLPLADAVLTTRDVRPLIEPLLRAGAAIIGERHDVAAAEEFRVVRYGGMDELLHGFGQRREEPTG